VNAVVVVHAYRAHVLTSSDRASAGPLAVPLSLPVTVMDAHSLWPALGIDHGGTVVSMPTAAHFSIDIFW
jgi:hypothetical protein